MTSTARRDVPGSDAPTWVVLARDISDSVAVRGQRRTVLAAVLDAGTGLAVHVAPGTSIESVLGHALKRALVAPAPPMPKAVPQRLVVSAELLQVTLAAASGLSWLADTTVTEANGLEDADEIMDSLVGHVEGRGQPPDLPSAGDYRVLYQELHAYVEGAPWTRWADEEWFTARIDVDGEQVELDCIVLGQAGVQHGFNAVPDADQLLAASVSSADDRLSHLEGALLVHLDPWREVSGRFADKARRYDWPSATPLAPSLASVHDGQIFDLSRSETRVLALALRGVLSQDARRLASADRLAATGELTLADGAIGRYDVGRP